MPGEVSGARLLGIRNQASVTLAGLLAVLGLVAETFGPGWTVVDGRTSWRAPDLLVLDPIGAA